MFNFEVATTDVRTENRDKAIESSRAVVERSGFTIYGNEPVRVVRYVGYYTITWQTSEEICKFCNAVTHWRASCPLNN